MHTATAINLEENLNRYFGFKQFKGQQKEIIESILDGKDTLVIMPTGGGKSLCYQLPAILSEGIAIIVSPLIALMKNQVDLVRGYSSNDSIAHFMNSSLRAAQLKEVKQDLLDNKTKLLYVAPETLSKESTIEFLSQLKISFVAVDEAHCISEWGHDFRPKYREIKESIKAIQEETPIIALTATATPKVQSDIMKTMKMRGAEVFLSSFNRDNLFYEIRAKKDRENTIKNIVQFVKQRPSESGIVYCLNRKTTEDLAETLQVNGVKAAAYHAGLDGGTRSNVQDMFLMEDVDVICATIAFGMGIDKPDVRFVVHFDIPKSLENYYQETGRAGRDGMGGICVAYFSHTDINKMDKLLSNDQKSVKEREIGGQHLSEIVAYSESAACRRKFLLHYFGEVFDDAKCEKGCDNCADPLPLIDATSDVKITLEAVLSLGDSYPIKYLVNFIAGSRSKEINANKHNTHKLFGKGVGKDKSYWNSVVRRTLLDGYLDRGIENYGIIKMSETGLKFIDKPIKTEIALNRDFKNIDGDIIVNASAGAALDDRLYKLLKDLRKKEAKDLKLPPFVIFQDASLSDMATAYPITREEMANIVGVSQGKAIKFGKPFLELIAEYVEENKIDRPADFVTKQKANKSKTKVQIIQNIDKKIPLNNIAESIGMNLEGLFQEIEVIIASGTKLNIDYFINEYLDEDQQEEIFDCFMETETDELDLDAALKELDDDDYTLDDMRMMKVKFLCKVSM
ncbi:UNVERIFIED_CONTAM: hypothetical protein GTU68_066760 [Idotea baltica]|nr:hypothetical protein [Idotea baltica]